MAAFEKNIFGVYKPQLLIITTPNAEFNVHFPNLNYLTPESTFRHDDHKFEWTRAEVHKFEFRVNHSWLVSIMV